MFTLNYGIKQDRSNCSLFAHCSNPMANRSIPLTGRHRENSWFSYFLLVMLLALDSGRFSMVRL